MVKRAGSQPLTVVLSWPGRIDGIGCGKLNAPVDTLRKLLSTHVSQIDTLIMPIEIKTLVKHSAQARLLRRLVFIQPPLEDGAPLPVVWAFPRLEELEAPYSFRSSLHTICSSSLRRLVLRPGVRLREPQEYYFATPAELVRSLANTPLLELLDVELIESEPGREPLREVLLPRLRTLRLVGDIRSCANVFQSLAMPRDVQIRIPFPSGRCVRSMDRIWSTIASWAGQRAEVASEFKPTRSLSFAVSDGGCMLQGWRTERELSQALRSDSISELRADVQLAIPRSANNISVSSLLTALPHCSLQILEIGPILHADNTREILARLCTIPSLRVLVMKYIFPEVALELIATTTAREVLVADVNFRQAGEEWLIGDGSEALLGGMSPLCSLVPARLILMLQLDTTTLALQRNLPAFARDGARRDVRLIVWSCER